MLKEIVIALFIGAFSQAASAQVLAKVGKSEITVKEFKKKYEEVRRLSLNPPTPEVFLEDLVRFEMGVQEAERRKLSKDPEVQEQVRQTLYKALLEKEIGKKVDAIKVSEAEMRQYYKDNPELRSSHILVEIKPDASAKEKEAAHRRALEILKDVRASKKPFEDLVKLYSDDSLSKTNGGDIGYQNRITVVPSYYETLLHMKPNQISGPVETIYGYHIVKLTGRRKFQEANRAQIRAAVIDMKRKKLFDQFFNSISKRYPVVKNEKALSAIK